MNERCALCDGEITNERPALGRLAISVEPLPLVEVSGAWFLLALDWPPICAPCLQRSSGADLLRRVQGLTADQRRARQEAAT